MDLEAMQSTYRQNGVAYVRGLFSPSTVSDMAAEALRLWQSQEELNPNNLRIGLRKNAQGGTTLERLDPVSDISDYFRALNEFSGLIALAEMALKSRVTVLKEKLIYKWPHTSGYGLHRDEPYFGLSGVPGKDMVSISIAIDDANDRNGAIKFYPPLRNLVVPAPDDEPRDIVRAAVSEIAPLEIALTAGDVVLFDGLVPHESGFNFTELPRRTYTVTFAPVKYVDCRATYYEARSRLLEEDRISEYPGEFFLK